MNRRFVTIVLGICLTIGVTGVYAATANIPNPMKAELEMRKNIAWTVEGLYQLGKSKVRDLRLTPAQRKKILPLYQKLIAKKIIQLKLKPVHGKERGGPQPDDRVAPKRGAPDARPGGDFRQAPSRLAKRKALIAFGNAKMEAINRILTKKQVEFIDNWDFKAEKYGFPGLPNFPGGKGHFGGPPPGGDRPHGKNPSDRAKARRPNPGKPDPRVLKKLEEGRKRLVKLNQAVLKMLR
jgi:hypothetical protein